MVPAEYLELEAAESIVGRDYIWGCQNYRMTHEDLPADFTLSQIKLPEFDESQVNDDDAAISDIMGALAAAEGQNKGASTNSAFAKANAGESVSLDDYDMDEKVKESQSFNRSTLMPGAELLQKEEKEEIPSYTAGAAASAPPAKPIFADVPLTSLPQIPVPAEPVAPVEVAPAVEPSFATQLPTMPTLVTEPPVEETVEEQEPVVETPSLEVPPLQMPTLETPAPVEPKPAAPKAAPVPQGNIEDLFA